MSSFHILSASVRLNIKKKFSKGNDTQFSSDIFKVIGINGSNITLDNGNVYKRDKLLNITNNMPTLDSKIKIDNAYTTGKIDRKIMAEGVDKSNIIKSKKSVKKILKDDGINASNIVSSKRIRNNVVTFN